MMCAFAHHNRYDGCTPKLMKLNDVASVLNGFFLEAGKVTKLRRKNNIVRSYDRLMHSSTKGK